MKNTRWYINNFIDQMSNMSIENFEDFYFSISNLNYHKMCIAMDQLVNVMNKTDKVHIKGSGTDLKFSIK